MEDELGEEVDIKGLREILWVSLPNSLRGRLFSSLKSSLWDSLFRSLKFSLWSSLGLSLWDSLDERNRHG